MADTPESRWLIRGRKEGTEWWALGLHRAVQRESWIGVAPAGPGRNMGGDVKFRGRTQGGCIDRVAPLSTPYVVVGGSARGLNRCG